MRNKKNFTDDYNKRLRLRCINHFKSDLINNTDHMRMEWNEHRRIIFDDETIFSGPQYTKCLLKHDHSFLYYQSLQYTDARLHNC